jgi:D-sedoheptulose 7-phosphate isomerase
MMSFVQEYKADLVTTINAIDLAKVEQIIDVFKRARAEGKHIFTCGNGGSASTASHFVCDIVKGASYKREAKFKVTSLCDNLATIMAYANDVTYDCVFVEQLRNLGSEGDVLLGISGSGNSPNVLNAFEYANSVGHGNNRLDRAGRRQIGAARKGHLNVGVPHMGRIEDAHMIVCHMIGYYFMDTER